MKQKKPAKICPNTALCASVSKMGKKIRLCELRGLYAVTTRQLQRFIVLPHINILNGNLIFFPKVDNSSKQKAKFLRVLSVCIIVSLLFIMMGTIVALKKLNYILPSSDRLRISLTNCATLVVRSS
jgi:hypothetical protein